jgi:NADH:ubiquinone oxidoreductase subunit F (NADH-binding)
MTEIFRRIARGGGNASDYDKMGILAEMLVWSNCVHGSAAPTIMAKSADFFREEIDAHIYERRCPAQVCPDLIRYEVFDKSDKMAEAQAICPVDAIEQDEASSELASVGGWRITEACIRCDACREIAPEAIRIVDAPPAGPPVPPRAHLQGVGKDARGRMN